MILDVISDAADRYHEQVTTGEWSGAAQRDWLAWRWPCGRVECRVCDSDRSSRAYRALPPWSQVMAAEGPKEAA